MSKYIDSAHYGSFNIVNQRMLHFPKCVTFLLLGSLVALILFLDANFAQYCIQRQIGFFPCILDVD